MFTTMLHHLFLVYDVRILIVGVLQVEYLPVVAEYKTSAALQTVVAVILLYTFSIGDRSGLQTGLSSTHTQCL